MITKRSYTAQEETTASSNTRIPIKIYQRLETLRMKDPYWQRVDQWLSSVASVSRLTCSLSHLNIVLISAV